MRLLTAAGVVLLAAVAPAIAQTKYAVVVGVNKYADKKLGHLTYAEADADALTGVLKKAGFQVTTLLGANASKKEVEAALDAVLAKGTSDDTLLFAFSGHGQQFTPNGAKDDVPFLCPPECDAMKADTQIPLNALLDRAGKAKVGKALFLLDACRTDPGGARGGVVGNKVVELKAQTEVLFAASNGQQAQEHKDLGHGLFMAEVIDSLGGKAKNEDGEVTWDGLVARVKGGVTKRSKALFPGLEENKHQTPHKVGSLVGDVVLVRTAGGAMPGGLKAEVGPGVAPPKPAPGGKPPAPLKVPFQKKEADDARRQWAAHLGVEETVEVDLGGGQKLKLVLVPPGEFRMGAADGDPERMKRDDNPAHGVTITQPFLLGETEVTQAQYGALAQVDRFPSTYRGKVPGQARNQKTDLFPVETVPWQEAHAVCAEVGVKARALGGVWAKAVGTLPTEAEFEWACRGGTATPFPAAKFPDLGAHTKSAENRHPRPVGEGTANTFGLHDMVGNVSEWCRDWYDKDFYTATNSAVDPVQNSRKVNQRVIRGGSWMSEDKDCGSAVRNMAAPGSPSSNVGFRVCVWLTAPPAPIK